MSASVGTAPSGGRRKSLDAEINLVPFIDLLSMCICFLLITAVWVQIGALQVKQSHGTTGAAMTSKDLELEVTVQGDRSADLVVKRGGKALKKTALSESEPRAFLAKLDESVRAMASGPVAAAMLTPGHASNYGDLVSVMDVLRHNHISNIGVVPVRN
jgi:biopolymer transport protein TolR